MINNKTIVVCPYCQKSGFINLHSIELTKSISCIKLNKNTLCEHQIHIYIDKNYVVRGYEKIDYFAKIPSKDVCCIQDLRCNDNCIGCNKLIKNLNHCLTTCKII